MKYNMNRENPADLHLLTPELLLTQIVLYYS